MWCKCRFIERDYVTPLMRYRLECPANRYVFKSHLNYSSSEYVNLRLFALCSELDDVTGPIQTPVTFLLRIFTGIFIRSSLFEHGSFDLFRQLIHRWQRPVSVRKRWQISSLYNNNNNTIVKTIVVIQTTHTLCLKCTLTLKNISFKMNIYVK